MMSIRLHAPSRDLGAAAVATAAPLSPRFGPLSALAPMASAAPIRLSRRETLEAGILDLLADCRGDNPPADAMARIRALGLAACPRRTRRPRPMRVPAEVTANAFREAN